MNLCLFTLTTAVLANKSKSVSNITAYILYRPINANLKSTKSLAVARVGPTVLVVTDLESHLKLMIFISSE